MFPGAPTADLLHQAAQSPRPLQVIKNKMGAKFVEYTTVIVRVHDNQRLWIPPKSYYGDMDNQYLPEDKLQKFAFQEQREKINDLAKKYIPSAFNKETFRDAIEAAIKLVSYTPSSYSPSLEIQTPLCLSLPSPSQFIQNLTKPYVMS